MNSCWVRGVTLLAVTSDALRKVESQDPASFEWTARMQWWQPPVADKPLQSKYLVFSPDVGGLNNVRIGWEFAGVIAQKIGRTLVLPPPTGLYLLDWGPGDKYDKNWLTKRPPGFGHGSKTAIEDLINLKQLKGYLPTLTSKEFFEKTGKEWETVKKQSRGFKEHKEEDCKSSVEAVAQIDDELILMDGGERQPFSCGEWYNLGGPDDSLRTSMQDKDWALLTHGFVWHPDAFEIASKVVNYLGLFQYNGLHARYGDLQFKESREEPSLIFANWPSLKGDEKLYVASDAPEKFKTASNNVLVWSDFFSDKTGHLLSSEKARYSTERFFKLTGLVEQLICTYAKLFVGTEKSTFSGGIQRMRKQADTPNSKPVFHTKSGSPTTETKLSFERKPEDKGTIFLQLN